MEHVYLYLFVAAVTTYIIRTMPLTLIRREISNTFIRSFLYYVPYVTLTVMAFPAIIMATNHPASGIAAFMVAVVAAYIDGNLFKVAVAACAAVFLTELIVL